MCGLRDRDRGAIALEAVLILPVVLALIMAVLSVALWMYARDVALNAARQGLAAARDNGASIADGVPAATAFGCGETISRALSVLVSLRLAYVAVLRVFGWPALCPLDRAKDTES